MKRRKRNRLTVMAVTAEEADAIQQHRKEERVRKAAKANKEIE